MSTNLCGCTRREILVAQVVGKYIHKHFRCKNCGRMFTEDEMINDFNFPDKFTPEWDIKLKNNN